LWSSRKTSIGVIGATLIGSGIVLAVGPSLFVQMIDNYVGGIHRGEAQRRMQTYAPPSQEVVRPAARTIVPGREGYVLEIPKIGVQVIVHELELDVFSGENTPTLKHYGVGQLPYTQDLRNVSPGAEGTAVITGHRTTSGAPFRHIDQLSPGDVIIIRSGTLEQRWEVVYSTTVAPTQTDAIRSFPGVRRLVVLACNPVFSARERLVVYSRLAQESTQ
jgi:sortase A